MIEEYIEILLIHKLFIFYFILLSNYKYNHIDTFCLYKG